MKINVTIPSFFGALIFILLLTVSQFTNAQSIDFGKSYINVTKGLSGGTVETNDVLEIRAAFVVRSGTYDSCGYTDAVPAGTSFISGTIRVLTNEGKIYKQFTDAANDDEGWISGSTIKINLGYNQGSAPARWYRRGRIANTDRPSFYSGTCIMIASFRVTVTAAIGSIISTGGGSMTYKSGGVQTFTFPSNTVAVYTNFGICSNSVGTNALGTEFNGTFGSGKPRNRGSSANVPPSYTYDIFTGNTPNDYYYGIANNTSTINAYTTSNAWAKPDGSAITHRVFQVWDIIGDHTGAASPTAGNPAADTVANSNAGYMLVINASYRIDSAFQQTISNLCPNTYYEISCWMRNICSKCGCDSTGRGNGNVGYIPTAAGDSSGVYPNLTFEVNGVDYYTTGNLLYSGKWVKKGFTFLTGPSQTSFTLKFFNNAPGGGGNDWALDDISVATCSPNLAFTPTNQPTVCAGNVVDIGSYIRSFFNNYTYFKWEKSTNNGVTWTSAGLSGTGSPTWNGSAWEYFTAYPTFVAYMSDSGTKFRVVVATTDSNLLNTSCSFSDVSSILTLNVINCGAPLSTDIISFSGKMGNNTSQLKWTTSKEEEPVHFVVERSSDGRTYQSAGTVAGSSGNSELNYYSWSEPYSFDRPVFYRIKLMAANRQKLSRTIKLSSAEDGVGFGNIPNPFTQNLVAEVTSDKARIIYLHLIDNSGKTIIRQQFAVTDGTTTLHLPTESLAAGLYTLQLLSGDKVINKRVLKQ
jgi:hypothetical protein